MSESESEAAGKPAAEGAAAGGAAGAGGQGTDEQFSKQLMAAYGLVIAVAGGISGVVAVVEPFTKGGFRPVVLTLAALTLGALVVVGGHKVNVRLRRPLTKPRQVMAGIAVATFALGAVIGYLIAHHTGPTGGPGSNSGSGSSTTAGALPFSATPGPTVTTPSPSPTPTSTTCDKPLAITSPANGASVVGATGVDVDITACGLTAGESAWLFDYDVSSGSYGLDGDGGPILAANQTMTFDDKPIGQAGDVNEDTKLVLVLANSACNSALNGMNLENTEPTSLPQSCQIASEVEIVETW